MALGTSLRADGPGEKVGAGEADSDGGGVGEVCPLVCLPAQRFPVDACLAGSGGNVLGPGRQIAKTPWVWAGHGARVPGSEPDPTPLVG